MCYCYCAYFGSLTEEELVPRYTSETKVVKPMLQLDTHQDRMKCFVLEMGGRFTRVLCVVFFVFTRHRRVSQRQWTVWCRQLRCMGWSVRGSWCTSPCPASGDGVVAGEAGEAAHVGGTRYIYGGTALRGRRDEYIGTPPSFLQT